MLASWGAGFGIKGRLDQLVEGAVGVMRGWPPCLGWSEPGPGWQGGAAQELGQGKCSVKVRVRAVGLSEGRGGEGRVFREHRRSRQWGAGGGQC